MDTCYLLLGRPQQFDKGMTHDDRADTYSYVYMRVKIVLVPDKNPIDSKPMKQSGSTSMLSLARFEEELQDLNVVFALVGKEVDREVAIPKVTVPVCRRVL